MKALNLMLLSLLASLLFGFVGCSGGGSSGGGAPAASVNPPSGPEPTSCQDVEGQWLIEEDSTSAICGSEFNMYTLTVDQTDCSLVVTSDAGVFSGSIDGNTITWAGSYPEDGGTVTLTGLTVTVSDDGLSLEGTSTWSWTDGFDSCTGTTQIFGVRL